jgi:Tol biopolymer transport system component/DNA-binding winged helix-turn-helix (wHTH) protein
MRAFGPFELDPRTGELTRNGTRVRLQPQQGRLLALLTSHPGRVYSREEIYQALWTSQSYGNFEQSLNFAVSQLRAALADSAESSLYIETVPKRGYRFVATVEDHPDSHFSAIRCPDTEIPIPYESNGFAHDAGVPDLQVTGAMTSTETAAPHQLPSRLWWRSTAMGATLLAVLSAAWWYLPLQPPRTIGFAQLTTTGAIDFLVKPVTDGARVFYIERSGGHWIAKQTSLEGGESQTVPGLPENTRIMDLSPNRATYLLGRFTSRGSMSTLWLMPVQGGPPVRLGDVTSDEAVWHPDGKHIVYARGNELWSVGTDAANPRLMVSLPGVPNWLAWSPDGQRMRLTLGDDNGGSSLWEMRQDGSRLHRLFPNADDECCGEWTPDGRYFLYTARHQGVWNLWAAREPGWWLRRAPRGPFQLIAGWPGGVVGAHVSSSGNSVLFYAGRNRSQIQRLDVKTNRLTPISPEGFSQPEYSPDGRWLAYIDVNNGSLWKVNIASSEKVQLSLDGFSAAFPRWSPDGATLAVTANNRGAPATIYLIPAKGGAPQLLLPGQANVFDPDWSPDGKRLVVVHAVSGNPKETALFLVDLATRAETMVPGSIGRFFPHWSPDGRYVAAYRDQERVVELYDFATQKWQTVTRGEAIGFPVWSRDSRHLYYQRILDDGEPVYRLNVRTGVAERVASFEAVLSGGVSRCALLGLAPDDALLLDTTRGNSDLYRAELAQ